MSTDPDTEGIVDQFRMKLGIDFLPEKFDERVQRVVTYLLAEAPDLEKAVHAVGRGSLDLKADAA
jgi:hypothetical protein